MRGGGFATNARRSSSDFEPRGRDVRQDYREAGYRSCIASIPGIRGRHDFGQRELARTRRGHGRQAVKRSLS